MSAVVLDTSAVLAWLREEAGWQRVDAVIHDGDCRMSTVNWAELVAKLSERMSSAEDIDRLLSDIPVLRIPFDEAQARLSGQLRPLTRALGLSLGDRACIALALQHGLPVLSADRAWAQLEIGIPVELIRNNS